MSRIRRCHTVCLVVVLLAVFPATPGWAQGPLLGGDEEQLEKLKKQLERAADVTARGAKFLGEEREAGRKLARASELFGKSAGYLGKGIKALELGELIIELKLAIDCFDQAEPGSEAYALGAERLFATTGKIGAMLTSGTPAKHYFEWLAETGNFFSDMQKLANWCLPDVPNAPKSRQAFCEQECANGDKLACQLIHGRSMPKVCITLAGLHEPSVEPAQSRPQADASDGLPNTLREKVRLYHLYYVSLESKKPYDLKRYERERAAMLADFDAAYREVVRLREQYEQLDAWDRYVDPGGRQLGQKLKSAVCEAHVELRTLCATISCHELEQEEYHAALNDVKRCSQSEEALHAMRRSRGASETQER